MNRNPSVLLFVSIALSVCILGCNRQNDSPSIEEQKAFDALQSSNEPLVEINASLAQSEIEKFYGTKCESRSCIVESDPSLAPLTKPKGIPLCKVADYESKAISTLYFSKDGTFVGSSCNINEYDYQHIIATLDVEKVHKRYLDQMGVLDLFQVWKSKAGYITTYRESVRRNPNGGIVYNYYLYVGFEEIPNYSQYPAD